MQEMLLLQLKVMTLKKCVTIRPTSFDPAPSTGGSAEIIKADAGEKSDHTKFIKKKKLNQTDLNLEQQE